MASARSGDRVRIHYRGRFEDGSFFGDSSESGPVEFQIGSGEIFSAIQEAVIGMRQGERKTVQLDATQAFGRYQNELVREVGIEEFGDAQLRVGMRLTLRNRGLVIRTVTVTNIGPTTVTLDGNHPLAGQNLHVDINVLDVFPVLSN